MNKCRYIAYFNLDGTPEEYSEAQEYLLEDNMLNYYDGLGKDKIKCMEWHLNKNWKYSSGFILVDTYKPLSEEELTSISSYITGQNSDGLGEGFEQNFYYTDVQYVYDEMADDYIDVENEAMCCFDWEENDYKLYRYLTFFNKEDWDIVDSIVGHWEESEHA